MTYPEEASYALFRKDRPDEAFQRNYCRSLLSIVGPRIDDPIIIKTRQDAIISYPNEKNHRTLLKPGNERDAINLLQLLKWHPTYLHPIRHFHPQTHSTYTP